jgi:hypothetical protein
MSYELHIVLGMLLRFWTRVRLGPRFLSPRSCQEAWVHCELLGWAGHWHEKMKFKFLLLKIKLVCFDPKREPPATQKQLDAAEWCNTSDIFQSRENNFVFASVLKCTCPYFSAPVNSPLHKIHMRGWAQQQRQALAQHPCRLARLAHNSLFIRTTR